MTTLKRPRHDTVFLRKLSTRAIVGPDRWHNRHIQPVEISIEMSKKERIVTRAGDDNVDISIRYDMVEAAVSKAITSKATFDNLPQLVEAIYQATDAQINVACSVTIAMTVKLPKGLLLTDGVGYSTVWESTASLSLSESFCPATGRPIANTCVFVENLRASCVIGMLAQERPESQAVIINLWFYNEDYRVLETVLQELSEYVIVLSKVSCSTIDTSISSSMKG